MSIRITITCVLLVANAVASTQEPAPVAPQAPDAQPISLVGRIVDEDGHAIASHRLGFYVRLRTVGSSSSQGHEVATDNEGRFKFDLAEEVAAGETRELMIGEAWNEKLPTLHDAAATVDLSAPLAPGIHDLGDIALRIPGSRKLLRKMTDTELERNFIEARRGHAFTDDARHDADTCLTEMIERGGPRWEKFIARQLEVSRKRRVLGVRENESGKNPIEDVALLTALRRVQHQADPVVLVVSGEPIIETVFPADPLIHYRVKNVDPDGEAIALWTSELEQQGMNRYCRVDVRASDGSIVEHYEDRKFAVVAQYRPVVIPPDGSADSTVGLEYFVHLPRVGEYQAILHQRHGDAGSEFAYSKGPVDSWICSSSDAFTIRVLPREIIVSTVQRDRLIQQFLAIDVAKPTLIVWLPWKTGDELKESATAPEDELYLAGWTGVPVLQDVLDDGTSTPQARAWALALLADITGLERPARSGVGNVAWGRYRICDRWPGLKRSLDDKRDDKPRDVEGPATPDVAQQAELIHRWKEIRSCLSIHE